EWTDIDPANSDAEIINSSNAISLKIPKASTQKKMIRVVATIPG
ncbi:MAG: hypothetical protein ACJAT6_001410, partial [Akkermansiaceae bacterium]